MSSLPSATVPTAVSSDRAHNFNPGPAALPLAVLERARAELLDYRGTGMSVLEISHRSPPYEALHQRTIENLKTLLGGAPDHEVLFFGGGARTQFAAVPMNLLPPGGSADYLVTGSWSVKAVAEAAKRGTGRVAWTGEDGGWTAIPEAGEADLDPAAAYLHYTSNNTIYGTQYHRVPEPPRGVPLVCDMSSDILCRPVDPDPFQLIYAGAQKNLGAAGVTVVLVRRDFLEAAPEPWAEAIPDTLSYRGMAAKSSLLNTPPVYAIYLVGLVAERLLETGGAEAAAERNAEKAALLYQAIDGSDGFYRGHARRQDRSLMNVTFRLPSPELEARFLELAGERRMVGLKGHRSVGGLRASLYNSVERSSVERLVELMEDFRRRH